MQPKPVKRDSAPAAESIIYEQPLTERVRTFLRLQFLLSQAEQYAEPRSSWDSRMAIMSLLDIADMLTRGNARGEALKELDSQIGILALLRDNPDVDNPRLLEVLDQLEHLKRQLGSHTGPLGQGLRNNEFLSTIKNRTAIPGGTCEFDLPGYHFWLSKPNAARAADVADWLAELKPLREAVSVLLDLNRQSGDPVNKVAEGGVFQHNMQNESNCQLIRVILPGNAALFPEISGGRHRITIRFFDRPNVNERPRQVTRDVKFQLMFCHL
ncbi:MAG TPA: cell division protein ZapD [Gammaproteobacteria bacterium]|nr:cell division protein ZapD [Gammaproteobacteria bacterium]